MSPRSRLLVALLSTALIGYVALGSLLGRVLGDTSYGQLAIFNEVVRLVLEAYVEPVNLDRAMAGARLGLGDALDGDSGYLDPEEFRLYQQPPHEMDADIGAVLTRRFTFLMVVATRAGSPAEKAGLRTGDILKSIDSRHSRGLQATTGQRLLRGAPGSVVKLGILRAGQDPFEVSVVRERITPAEPSSRVLEDGTGYLRIPEFSPKVADEVRNDLETLKRGGAVRLVLDLRDAAFGPPAEGTKVAELFVKGGVVAKLAGTKVAEQVFNRRSRAFRVGRPAGRARGHGQRGSGGDRGRRAPRRRPRLARGRAHVRPRGNPEGGPPSRGRPRADRGPLLVAQGEPDPRPGVEPTVPVARRRRRRRRTRPPAIPSSTRPSRCCAPAPRSRKRPEATDGDAKRDSPPFGGSSPRSGGGLGGATLAPAQLN